MRKDLVHARPVKLFFVRAAVIFSFCSFLTPPVKKTDVAPPDLEHRVIGCRLSFYRVVADSLGLVRRYGDTPIHTVDLSLQTRNDWFIIVTVRAKGQDKY